MGQKQATAYFNNCQNKLKRTPSRVHMIRRIPNGYLPNFGNNRKGDRNRVAIFTVNSN